MFTRTVISVEFEKCSKALGGQGRPITVTYSDGATRRDFVTWAHPAPKVGAIHGVSAPYGTPMAAGWARRT